MYKLLYKYIRKNRNNIIDRRYIHRCSLPVSIFAFTYIFLFFSIVLFVVSIGTSTYDEFIAILFTLALLVFFFFIYIPKINYFIFEDTLESKYIDDMGNYIFKFNNYSRVVGVDKITYDSFNVFSVGIVPINFLTLLVVSFFGIPGLFLLVLFSFIL